MSCFAGHPKPGLFCLSNGDKKEFGHGEFFLVVGKLDDLSVNLPAFL
jgi:hypothetical protein